MFYKCFKCKEFILDTKEIQIPKIKNGELQYLKNGNMKTTKYHSKCYDEICQWNNLKKYLEDNYFSVKIPKELIIKLRQLNQRVSFLNIHECFESIENDLMLYIANHSFNDDIHKSNYLMYQLNRNINTFVENKNKRIVDDCTDVIDLITEFPLFTDDVKHNYKESENFEILD
ncbi:MAG: hypothetical protein ACM3O3_12425 [Syntrophothermus sp.]